MMPARSIPVAALSLFVFGAPALAEMPTAVGEGEGQVDIVAWPGYIERGDTDKNYDWVTEFEKATGCKVNVKTAATSDEMVTLMNQGGFDLVTASGDASLRLVAGKKVQPVNIELVPSWKTVDDRLKNAPWHTVDGVHYGVPFQRARARTIVIGLMGGAAPSGLGTVTASTLSNFVPGGLFIGLAVSSVAATACTRSIGRIFVEHFENGATLADFPAVEKR